MKNKINANEVEKKISRIVGLRGKKRGVALSTATTNLYNYLKKLNYDNVTRGFLNSFFSDDISPETRRRVLRAIINELKRGGRIKEEYKTETITYFENCPLFSQDYGSYSIMMEKNKRRPEHLRGVYSMSRLSIRKRVKSFQIKAYAIL